jgi:hypothetical protein
MGRRKKPPHEKERDAEASRRRVRKLGVKPEDGPLIREVLGILSRYRIEEHLDLAQEELNMHSEFIRLDDAFNGEPVEDE